MRIAQWGLFIAAPCGVEYVPYALIVEGIVGLYFVSVAYK